VNTVKATQDPALALATVVKQLVDEYPMGEWGERGLSITLTIGGGLAGSITDVSVPVDTADAITGLIERELDNNKAAHPDQSGQCAHCRGTGLAAPGRLLPEALDGRALELRYLTSVVETLVLERILTGGWNEPLYLSEVHEQAAPGRYTPAEVQAAIGAAIAQHGLEDVADVRDYREPDWHCVVHGEWGDGGYACGYCERDEV